jgi:hypothetical protein
MELNGEEKKIQAPFSELRTADEQTAPPFARSWNRAQIAPRKTRVFSYALAGMAVLLVGVLVSFAMWSKFSERPRPTDVAGANLPTTVNLPPPIIVPSKMNEDTPAPPTPPRRNVSKSPAQIAAARRHAALLADNRKLTQTAKAISNWQSPTADLLNSSSDELFSSLPQLNENANELKSFLPSRPN